MIFGKESSLEELIIFLLAEKNSASALWLREQIGRGHDYSYQAIYKSLNKLLKSGVLVRVQSEYSLKLTWITDFLALGDRLQKNYIQQAPLDKYIEALGLKPITWHFRSLSAIDDFWAHLLVFLYRHTDRKVMFEWVPHPWYELIHRFKETSFQTMLRREKKMLYLVVGRNTPIDELSARYWPRDVYCFSFAKSPFAGQSSKYFNVIGDYVFTLHLVPHFAERLDRLYAELRSTRDEKFPQLIGMLDERTRIRAVLEKNPRKALALTKTFCEYFGLRRDQI